MSRGLAQLSRWMPHRHASITHISGMSARYLTVMSSLPPKYLTVIPGMAATRLAAPSELTVSYLGVISDMAAIYLAVLRPIPPPSCS